MLDHKSECMGNLRCTKCNRPGCAHCLHGIFPPEGKDPFGENHSGECTICSGMYTEEEIYLFSIPMEWDI